MSTFSVILIALLALAAGIVVGILLWRKLGSQPHQSRELEEKLKEAEQRLSNYQAEVAEHFLETSRRVNDLTRNYKEVHEYLANSAMKLTDPSLGQEIQVAAQLNWSERSDSPVELEDSDQLDQTAATGAAAEGEIGEHGQGEQQIKT